MIFAVLTAVAAFGIGNMVQANSISSMVAENFSISPWITGIVMTVLTAVVIIGGIKSIAQGVRDARAVHGHFLCRRLPHSAGDELTRTIPGQSL